MVILKLLISILIIPVGFMILIGYLMLIQKVFHLSEDEYGYTIPIGFTIMLFCFLVYQIYIELPF